MLNEIKRAVFNAKMLLLVLFLSFVLIRPLVNYGLFAMHNYGNSPDYLYWMTFPESTSGFAPYAAFFPALAYVTSFIDEYNSGYLRLIMVRKTPYMYSVNKVVSVGLSGGLIILIPNLIAAILVVILGTPTTPINSISADYYLNTMWYNHLFVFSGIFVIILKLLLSFFFGCSWALIAYMVAVIVPNKYVAVFCPFIIYQTLWRFMKSSPYNPVYLLSGNVDANLLLIFIGQLLLWIIIFILSKEIIKMRKGYI